MIKHARKGVTALTKRAQIHHIAHIRDMLDDALSTSNIWRIHNGLKIQSFYPDQDFLKHGDHRSLYPKIWRAHPAITEMYIKTYWPTSKDCTYNREFSLCMGLADKTRKDWIAAGCGDFATPLLISAMEKDNVNLDEIKTLINQEGFDPSRSGCDAFHKSIRKGHTDIIDMMLEKAPFLLIYNSVPIIKAALEQENTNTLETLIDKGLDIFTDDEFAFSTAKEQGKLEHLKILEQVKRDKIAKEGLTAPRKSIDDWVALSETFVEYTRPQSPDGCQNKYQIDFDSGYMTYTYKNEGHFIPFALKPLAEVYNENPQLIEKAVEALTALGCPAPDLKNIFNKPAAKSICQVIPPKQNSKTTLAPDRPSYRGPANVR
jgi:hypothetical protein